MKWSKEFLLHFGPHPKDRNIDGVPWVEWLHPTSRMPSVEDHTNFAKRGFGPFDWVQSWDYLLRLIRQWEYWEDDDGV